MKHMQLHRAVIFKLSPAEIIAFHHGSLSGVPPRRVHESDTQILADIIVAA